MIPTLNIRTATLSDTSGIDSLLEACYPHLMKKHYNEDILRKALPLMTKAQPSLLQSGTFYVAEIGEEEDEEEEDRKIIGCGGWTKSRPGAGDGKEDPEEEQLGHIRHFGVHPDYVGCGIGKAIFRRCLDDARASGIGCFECYSSLNGEGFYSALGFTRLHPVDVPMGPELVFPAILMSLSLCQA